MAHETLYPGADRAAQWRGNGGVTMASVSKVVLHTTESAGWPEYPSFQPTLTFHPFKPRGERWRQHLPINGSASTLRNAGAFRTNRADCCQIEIVAYCDPACKTSGAHISKISDDAYHELGEFLAWMNREWEVPLKLAPNWLPYPASYGNTSIRMSTSEYSAFKGVLGHQHVPGNSHGDPGALNVQAILNAALQTGATVITNLRTMSFNVRNKTAVADIPFPSRHWSKRLPVIVKLIKDNGPSVIGVQECRNDMCVDITNGLGPNWTFWGARTSKIIWNTEKWVAVDQWEGGLPFTEFGVRKQRPVTMLKLRSIRTGGECWFISTHLTVSRPGLDQSRTRIEQMELLLQYLRERPDNGRAVILGDFNDSSETGGVRAVAKAAGYQSLRTRLSDEAMTGDSRSTWNGWKPTLRNSRWIDDCLTPRYVTPYAGVVVLADTTTYPIHASDHNAVRASVSFTSANLP